jgi:hypothetical protein
MTLADHLTDAVENVRAANHAALNRRIDAAEAYDVAGALDELVGRLPQLVAYLARVLDRAPRVGLFDDRGRDPEEALTDAGHALAAVIGALDALGVHTRAAHNALGHLGRVYLEV